MILFIKNAALFHIMDVNDYQGFLMQYFCQHFFTESYGFRRL